MAKEKKRTVTINGRKKTLQKGEWYSEKDGHFHWEGTGPDGKKKKLNRKDLISLRNAKAPILQAWELELDPDNLKKTLDDVGTEYFHSIKGKRKITTYNTYLKVYNRYIVPEFGDVRIDKIKYEQIEEFAEKLYYEKDLSKDTTDQVIMVLKSMFKLAIREGWYILANPTDGVLDGIHYIDKQLRGGVIETVDGDPKTKILLEKKKKFHQKQALSMEDVQRYAHALKKYDPFLYPIFMVLFGTGIRASELAGLQWEDVDLENGYLWVRRNLSYADIRDIDNYDSFNENEKIHRYAVTGTKNGMVRRIPLTPEVIDAFEFQKDFSKDMKRIETCGLNNFVFLSIGNGPKQGGRPYIALSAGPKLRALPGRLKRMTGQDFPKFTPHEARHTFQTRLEEFFVSNDVSQYVMGHKQRTITKAVYTHLDQSTRPKREFDEFYEKYSILEGDKRDKKEEQK